MSRSDPWGAAPTAVPATDSGADDADLDTTEPHPQASFERPGALSDRPRAAFERWFDPSPTTAPTATGEPAPPVIADARLPAYAPVVDPKGGIAPRLVAVLLAGLLVALLIVWVGSRII